MNKEKRFEKFNEVMDDKVMASLLDVIKLANKSNDLPADVAILRMENKYQKLLESVNELLEVAGVEKPEDPDRLVNELFGFASRVAAGDKKIMKVFFIEQYTQFLKSLQRCEKEGGMAAAIYAIATLTPALLQIIELYKQYLHKTETS